MRQRPWHDQPWGMWVQIAIATYLCWDAPGWVIGLGFLITANMSLIYWLDKDRR